MRRRHKQYTEEFKREALQLVDSSSKTVEEIAQDLGVSRGLIYKWRKRYRLAEETQELRPSESQEQEVEIRRLRKELERVKEEHAILKKAIRIFSKEASE